MKKETIKEVGKFLIDLSKITIGIAFLTPLVKNNNISIIAIISALLLAIGGFILINKGVKEDE